MAQAYYQPRIPKSQGWHSTPHIVWAVTCLGLLSAGFFYGLHKGSALATLTNEPGAPSSIPAQADDGLPIAPSAGLSSSPGDLLARAKLENELLYTDLQSFVCSEQIERYRGHLNGDSMHRIDTVSAQLSFENGIENYTDIYQDSHSRPALSSIPGAWSEGEFGTLLRQTRALLSTQPVSVQATPDLNGVPAVMYSFDISGNDSPWDLTLTSKQYRVPFRTAVWVSKSSGQIMKIARTSTAMPPDSGISEIQWSVVLHPSEMGGKTWLLPSTGEYSVLYEHANRREWNVINFSNYHRYASRSVIHF